MAEFTGKITRYTKYNTEVIIENEIKSRLRGEMLRGAWRRKYPPGTRVQVEIDANNYVKSMIDAPVIQPFRQEPLPEIEVTIYDIKEGFTSYGN